MTATPKLNSMRLLESKGIPYEVLTYEPTTRDAEEVAELIGLPPFMVFKTLVMQSVETNKPLLMMLPSDCQLDLKKMAASAGEKKVRLATHADAEALTGLKVGGISALMLIDKNWKVYVDKSAANLQNIVISAGQRGVQLRVPTVPLLALLRARMVDAATPDT
jgi:Cys-tRNA(Pro)/Cys-tRNA(Cys) deacylase